MGPLRGRDRVTPWPGWPLPKPKDQAWLRMRRKMKQLPWKLSEGPQKATVEASSHEPAARAKGSERRCGEGIAHLRSPAAGSPARVEARPWPSRTATSSCPEKEGRSEPGLSEDAGAQSRAHSPVILLAVYLTTGPSRCLCVGPSSQGTGSRVGSQQRPPGPTAQPHTPSPQTRTVRQSLRALGGLSHWTGPPGRPRPHSPLYHAPLEGWG